MRFSFRRELSLMLSILAMVASVAIGVPHFFLTTTRPKCVSVVASEMQTLTIQYNMLGMYVMFLFWDCLLGCM